MSTPPAKFFVNQGVVNSRTDILHLLRPLLKQTVTYRYLRGRDTVAHGTGWVERIVVDADDVSTYFTPLAITLNIDSFEHLEFETRPDQLLVPPVVSLVLRGAAQPVEEEKEPRLLAEELQAGERPFQHGGVGMGWDSIGNMAG